MDLNVIPKYIHSISISASKIIAELAHIQYSKSCMQDPRCKHEYLYNLTERENDNDDESDKHL